MVVVDAILMVLAAALCVPVGMFCLEVLMALLPRRRVEHERPAAGTRVAVLIPAHNEQAVIAVTLRTLLPTVPLGTRVIVVADNCSDATAAIARECGAEAVERTDARRRGKGFALDFGIRHLSHRPPDAVVFLDADCRVAPDTVRRLAAAAIASQRPVQGLNLCDPNPAGGALQMASGLAFRFKNLVRSLGLVRLAGLNHLMGTGMALPWPLVERAKLANGNVVEDMQLGIDLTLAGKPPLFLPEARVDSPLPQQRAAARTQRTRWEHGHLKTLLTQAPRLTGLAIKHRRLDLFWLALDLSIPPLSLLAMILASATVTAAIAWMFGGSVVTLAVLVSAFMSLVVCVLAGWAVHCREQIPLRTLLSAPLYAVAKIPIYVAFLAKRQQQWVRTERDHPVADSRLPTPDSPLSASR
jgi:cellulose synthase/poly-beta-1,6-N-acetylglucosamine synthase-like glycosyltransferase